MVQYRDQTQYVVPVNQDTPVLSVEFLYNFKSLQQKFIKQCCNLIIIPISLHKAAFRPLHLCQTQDLITGRYEVVLLRLNISSLLTQNYVKSLYSL